MFTAQGAQMPIRQIGHKGTKKNVYAQIFVRLQIKKAPQRVLFSHRVERSAKPYDHQRQLDYFFNDNTNNIPLAINSLRVAR